jgi:succinate-semialdehyde dehydrogenase/glutarate-semialdehyde dehydrogenase
VHGDARPRFQTENPATGQKGQIYDGHTRAEVRDIVVAADGTFKTWRKRSYSERAALIKQAAFVLRRKKDEFAALMTEEMGKPISDGRAEVEKCATACDYFAENAERFLAQEKIDLGGPEAFVTFEPLGLILAIMPWNFPFWQVFRAAVPALMAGNAMLLKHASNVPGCALAIEQLLHEAGVPDDLFRTLLLPSSEIKALIEDDNIAAVTLTGSVAAGRSVASAAGGAIKKCVLELGGSDPYVVLEDVDVDAAAKVCATARMVNGGQSCVAGKRFPVIRDVLEQFEAAMVEAMRGYEMGNPGNEGTRLGPMQSVRARDEVHRQVTESIAKGAKLLLGGRIPDRPGAWYPPTVLTNVRPGQPAYDEEVFGPVAAIIAADDEADAIRIANSSPYGLGSAVLTSDLGRGRRIAAQEIEAGSCFVNENVRSDPRMPFGGVKQSGFGRELGAFGIREFVNIKSVHVHALASTHASAVE